MRLNYLEQLAKVYEYPYLQKDVPPAFPYQKRLPPRKENAGFFHTNCKITKRRVCTCSYGPAGKTTEDVPGTADNAVKHIADDLTLYFKGYTPEMIGTMKETKALEQERMKNMLFMVHPDVCLGDYLTEVELEALQREVDLAKMECARCKKIVQDSQHRKLVKTDKGQTIMVCRNCASEYDYTDINDIGQFEFKKSLK